MHFCHPFICDLEVWKLYIRRRMYILCDNLYLLSFCYLCHWLLRQRLMDWIYHFFNCWICQENLTFSFFLFWHCVLFVIKINDAFIFVIWIHLFTFSFLSFFVWNLMTLFKWKIPIKLRCISWWLFFLPYLFRLVSLNLINNHTFSGWR